MLGESMNVEVVKTEASTVKACAAEGSDQCSVVPQFID